LFELRNQSRFVARLLPSMATDGSETALVVVKGTYTIGAGGDLRAADKQAPLVLADEYTGEPGASSLRYASDVVPEKRGTDVILIGNAHAPRGRVTALRVALEAGPLRHEVAVIGDRRWQKGAGRALNPGEALPFTTMPLCYERAFGGSDNTHREAARWETDERNPIGCGLVANPQRRDIVTVALPNLEDPAALIGDERARPAPAGFGFVAPHWLPRRRHAGTYDERWRERRFPLLPEDFDPRFYNAAPPELTSSAYFIGGERVTITNASREGTLELALPAATVMATFHVDGRATEKPCDLDTVVIEPDLGRVMLTWRAHVRCHRKMKLVTGARVAVFDPRGSA
jgi:hypothetical protein